MVANDNYVFNPYPIRKGQNAAGEDHWCVIDARRNSALRITIHFPTIAQAERARDVLLADDRQRA